MTLHRAATCTLVAVLATGCARSGDASSLFSGGSPETGVAASSGSDSGGSDSGTSTGTGRVHRVPTIHRPRARCGYLAAIASPRPLSHANASGSSLKNAAVNFWLLTNWIARSAIVIATRVVKLSPKIAFP